MTMTLGLYRIDCVRFIILGSFYSRVKIKTMKNLGPGHELCLTTDLFVHVRRTKRKQDRRERGRVLPEEL